MATININIEIEVPKLPNFFRLKNGKGTIDLGDLSDEEYAEFEGLYIEGLRKHWKKRKK
jgi:hypothetical protein